VNPLGTPVGPDDDPPFVLKTSGSSPTARIETSAPYPVGKSDLSKHRLEREQPGIYQPGVAQKVLGSH
jgi:hypothetical protein